MSVVYESELKNSISAGKILPTYILYGDDGYLINNYENKLISNSCGKDNDFDLQRFERNIDLQVVFDALNQFPMMGDRKCVVLSDYDFESASAEDFERLSALLSDNYEFSTLIFRLDDIEFDVKRSKRAQKLISAVKKSGGLVVCLNHRNNAELAKMLVNGAKKRGSNLDISVAKYMVEICGSDINTLVSELEKVCYFAGDTVITKEIVNAVCIKSVEASVYEYAKKVIDCNSASALKILNELLYMRIKPISILYTTASAFIDIVRADAGKRANKSVSDIVEDFLYKNKEFVVSRAISNSRKFDDKKLSLCMNEILATDKLIKSFSYDDSNVLEQMTIRLIYIISNGEAID